MNNKILIFSKKRRGQSMAEFAITLTIILLLVSGAVDFGLAFFSYTAIRDAAQEGALYGSIDPTGDVVTRVRNSSTGPVNLLDVGSVHVTVALPASVCAGNPLTVRIIYEYPISTALIGTITGPTIDIGASATSTILNPPCPAP